MVDVVANHTGPVGDDFSKLNPFTDKDHFHKDCSIDWTQQWSIEHCRLGDLPDLDQENTFVRDYLKKWVAGIIKEYGFDGIRIDTVAEVSKDFWAEYAESAGVFQIGEVSSPDQKYVGGYQGSLQGVLNYPLFYDIGKVFGEGQKMYALYDN